MVCAHSFRGPAGHLELGHFANLTRLETMSNSVNESNTRRVSYLLVSDVEHPLGVSIMLEKFNSRTEHLFCPLLASMGSTPVL